MASTDIVTISTNYWRIPSLERAFDGWIEGAPTEQERLQIIEEVKAARKAWKPSLLAFELVEQLKSFGGMKAKLQFWDPIMWLADQEAPFPVEVNCNGVVILRDDEGFLQAYLSISEPVEIPTPYGYSAAAFFQERSEHVGLLAPVADLYSIVVVSANSD